MADATVGSLREVFSGQVVARDASGYDDLRRSCVWNGDIDRRPWLIVQPRTPQDVTAAVRFAQDAGREVTVRGGGHNFSGSCIADDALMIDLGDMHAVQVDPGARRATCGGGASWAQLDAATQEHALGTPGGFISHTGVAGLTLGGGFGWLTRRAGLSCDNLISVEIVTADGTVRRASQDDNPDLFWAVRGGAGISGL